MFLIHPSLKSLTGSGWLHGLRASRSTTDGHRSYTYDQTFHQIAETKSVTQEGHTGSNSLVKYDKRTTGWKLELANGSLSNETHSKKRMEYHCQQKQVSFISVVRRLILGPLKTQSQMLLQNARELRQWALRTGLWFMTCRHRLSYGCSPENKVTVALC